MILAHLRVVGYDSSDSYSLWSVSSLQFSKPPPDLMEEITNCKVLVYAEITEHV